MSKKNKKKQEVEQQNIETAEPQATQPEQVVEVEQSVEVQPEPIKKTEHVEIAGEPVGYQESVTRPDRVQPKPMPEVEKKAPKAETKDATFDPVEYASRHVENFNPSWNESIRAFQKHLGLAQKVSEADCIAFLKQWGAKLK